MSTFQDRLGEELRRVHPSAAKRPHRPRPRPVWAIVPALAIVFALLVIIARDGTSEEVIAPPPAHLPGRVSLREALGVPPHPASAGIRRQIPASAAELGLNLAHTYTLAGPAPGRWLVVDGVRGVCVLLGASARCGSKDAFTAGRIVAVSAAGDFTTGPLVFSGIVPNTFTRAVATKPNGTQVAETAIRGHAYRLEVDASAAATASIRLIGVDGRSHLAYAPFLPPDIVTLFPDTRAATAAEVQSYLDREPALVPESLRAVTAPPAPKGAALGSDARTWYVGATQRFICLWIGDASTCGPSATARDEGLSVSTAGAWRDALSGRDG